MFGELAALVSVALLAVTGNTPDSIVVTRDVYREGTTVYEHTTVVVDGEQTSESNGVMYCTATVRDAICGVVEATGPFTATYSRTYENGTYTTTTSVEYH